MSKVGDAIERARAKVATAATKFMPDVCVIYRPGEPVSDGEGGFTVKWEEIYSNVSCSYDALFGFERGEATGAKSVVNTYLELPATLVLTAKDKIVVEPRGENPELTFFVISTLPRAMDVLLTVYVTLSSENT